MKCLRVRQTQEKQDGLQPKGGHLQIETSWMFALSSGFLIFVGTNLFPMNKFLQDFDNELEDLKIVVDLPTDELTDGFEHRKARFQSFIQEAKATVEEVGDSEAARKLKTHLEELEVQLALGRAETRDAFDEQKKKLDHKLHEAQVAYEHWRDAPDANDGDLDKAFQHRTEHFRTQLDLFRVQYHLGLAEAREEWNEFRHDLEEKIHEIKQFWADRNKEGERRVEAFNQDMTEAYSHLKGAVRKLFS